MPNYSISEFIDEDSVTLPETETLNTNFNKIESEIQMAKIKRQLEKTENDVSEKRDVISICDSDTEFVDDEFPCADVKIEESEFSESLVFDDTDPEHINGESNNFEELLIDEIHQNPLIWDKVDTISGGNLAIRKQIWKNIGDKFPGISIDYIKTKWQAIKAGYLASLKRQSSDVTGENNIKSYKYSKQLSFLDDNLIQNLQQPLRRKRGRPPKVRLDEDGNPVVNIQIKSTNAKRRSSNILSPSTITSIPPTVTSVTPPSFSVTPSASPGTSTTSMLSETVDSRIDGQRLQTKRRSTAHTNDYNFHENNENETINNSFYKMAGDEDDAFGYQVACSLRRIHQRKGNQLKAEFLAKLYAAEESDPR